MNQFKRYRMEIDLRSATLAPPTLPDGYHFVRWHPLLAERHARIKWRAFRRDLDGSVFSCLSQLAGCRRLMAEISKQASFCPVATWMVVFQPEPDWPADDCGTIQGIERSGRVGAIQNVGIIPEHRGFGLGRAIVLKSLHAFRDTGLCRGALEVTAVNRPAVKLYRSLGFRVTRVLYRNAEGGGVVRGSERMPGRQDSELSASQESV
ncbi:MAG: N-acetyltransferase [Planctomycetaceae bacterium]